MVRYPASAACLISIFGPGTIAKDQSDKFGICPMLGRWSIPTSGTFQNDLILYYYLLII